MPSPARGTRANPLPQNGFHSQPAHARQSPDAQLPEKLTGFLALLAGSDKATPAGVSMSQLAGILRCVAALLEAASGQTAVGAVTSKPVGSEFKVRGRISVRAETLLKALVERRQQLEQTEPDHAWMTKHEWFPKTKIRRDCREADALVAELLNAELIDERHQGAKGSRHQFRATVAGAEYVMQLDPNGVFRRDAT